MDRIPSAVVVTPVLRLQQAIYRGSRGWIGRRLIGRSTLLLTTRGRRTGRQRTNALIFCKDGTSWVVVASNGGSDHSPGWLANLPTEPHVAVQVDKRKWPATARVASHEERARLWPVVNLGDFRRAHGVTEAQHRQPKWVSAAIVIDQNELGLEGRTAARCL